jgi:beta-xylosidase
MCSVVQCDGIERSTVVAAHMCQCTLITDVICAGNYFDKYAVGVARSQAIAGPYTKAGDPILHTNTTAAKPELEGPGHCSVVQIPNRDSWAILYHTWTYHAVVNFSQPRYLTLDELQWTSCDQGWPCVEGGVPSTTKKPLPMFEYLSTAAARCAAT